MGEVKEIATRLGGKISPPSPINSQHDLGAFDCGKEALDDWLKTRGLRSEGQTSRTYVCTVANAVVGYYCMSASSVIRASAPGKMRRNAPDPVPMLVIGRLAVTQAYSGKRLGPHLLKDALYRAIEASRIIGVRGVLVHAIDDEAVGFYKHHGFVEFPADSRTLFMPIETAIDALK